MALTTGQKMALWMVAPVLAAIAVVLAPEAIGVAVAAATEVAEVAAEKREVDDLKGAGGANKQAEIVVRDFIA